MEYIDGPTLAEVLRQADLLPPETVQRLFGQLLAGLAAAHAAGLIHRDIKSANLLLDCGTKQSDADRSEIRIPPSAILKIADFGLARLLCTQTRLTLPQSAFGTPEYMSPEQTRGDENVDQRSDLYSAGVVLYEMLTGRTPFRADAPTVVIHRILNEDAADPRTIDKSADPTLSSLSLRLMAKRPEDRFPTAEAAMEALQANRLISLPARRRRRRRLLAALLAVAFLIAAALWMQAPAAITAVRHVAGSNIVEVRRGKSAQWEVFHEFPPEIKVTGAALVDPGHDHKMVIVGDGSGA